METKDVILELRTKKGLSQDELAGEVMLSSGVINTVGVMPGIASL